jgi:hypothetical protein
MIVANPPGDAVALSCGQQTEPTNRWARLGAQKYAKFAYSARYGFSVESDPLRLSEAVLDSMIGFSSDGQHYRFREYNEEALLAGDLLFARWRPYADVAVESWVYWQDDHHVRVHRITTPRRLVTVEGGFAVPRPPGPVEGHRAAPGEAIIQTPADLSALFDLSPGLRRGGKAQIAPTQHQSGRSEDAGAAAGRRAAGRRLGAGLRRDRRPTLHGARRLHPCGPVDAARPCHARRQGRAARQANQPDAAPWLSAETSLLTTSQLTLPLRFQSGLKLVLAP